jgi:enoyl-CoA hydratase/carnithine racemase
VQQDDGVAAEAARPGDRAGAGVAAAAGCQLVAQCDLAVAAEGVRFGVNGIDVGLFCGTPSVPLVRNMQPKQAMEMLLTGGFITAAERARAAWSTAWWCPIG